MRLENELIEYSKHIKNFKESYVSASDPTKLVLDYKKANPDRFEHRDLNDEYERLKLRFFNYTGVDLERNTKKRRYVYMRAVFFMVAIDRIGGSYEKIAASVGRDHATVTHAKQEVMPHIMKHSPEHRKVYYHFMEIEDPDERRIENQTVEVKKSYLKSFLSNNKMFLKASDIKEISRLIEDQSAY
jgi:hypothetical protein